jgi:peptide/nickel transport system substrate-binding protein
LPSWDLLVRTLLGFFDGGEATMKQFQAIAGAMLIALIAGAARPAGAENVLRWASATEPLTFDPYAVAHLPTLVETSQVYEALVGFNSRYEIEPSLAVAWRLIDPTTWQFDLREGYVFTMAPRSRPRTSSSA